MTGLRFSAVVGQDEAKQALLLAAARPRLGGVLLRGDKGSAKTTLARGLAGVLPGEAPFVELPLGATEERVIGSLDLAELLTTGQPRFRPGLLASAHGGVLYVDEINLLADHLVDALLDVAVSGLNRVERDGLSHTHAARFVLVGSMNPEEGELRPQLLDRFGLAVDVRAASTAGERREVVRRQLAAEATAGVWDAPNSYEADDARLRDRLLRARDAAVELPDEVVDVATRLALEVGAEGLRADLMLCRAALACAALDGRDAAAVDDVRAVAAMVLGHRRRRRPFDEPGFAEGELEQAWDATSPDADDPTTEPPDPQAPDRPAHDDAHDQPAGPTTMALTQGPRSRRPEADQGGFGTSSGPRGRYRRAQPYDLRAGGPVDAQATAIAVASRRAVTPEPVGLAVDDLRGAEREQRVASLVVFVVDASASMGVERRMAATKAAVLGLLGDAYRRRGKVALITFHGREAEVVLRPTGSIEVARARLAELRTGGATPLAAGLEAARKVVEASGADRSVVSTVVVVTDGRATVGEPDPVTAGHEAMARLGRTGARVVVLDTETGHTRLGLAGELAGVSGAECLSLDVAQASSLEVIVREL